MNDKPFLKLLKSPLGWYFFDVNTQKVIQIDKDVYESLYSLLQDDCPVEHLEIKSKLQKLKKEGFLSSKRPKEIVHPELKWLKYHYERNIAKITLQLTQGCNLRCSYCIYSNDSYNQRKHSTKRMSFDIAKKSIDYILEHSIDQRRISISFYGGEPLLEFKLIKNIVKYVEKEGIGREIDFSFTTNGTLLNDEIVEFIISKNINVLISLDGPRNIHDESRKFAANGEGSFQIILDNITNALAKYQKITDLIAFNMVINPQNDFDYIHSFKKGYTELENIKLKSTIIDDINSIEKITYSDDYRCKYNYNLFLAFLYKFNRLNIDKVITAAVEYITDYESKIKNLIHYTSLPDSMAPGGPCIPGQLRLFVNTEGDFYPCERVSEISESMKIGNVDIGIVPERAEKLLNIGKITSENCLNCWAITMCGICCKHADDGKQLNPELKKTHCFEKTNSARELLLNKIMIDEIQSNYL